MFSALDWVSRKHTHERSHAWLERALGLRRTKILLWITFDVPWLTRSCSLTVFRGHPVLLVTCCSDHAFWGLFNGPPRRLTVMKLLAVMITTGVWSDSKRVKTLAFYVKWWGSLKCEQCCIHKRYWTKWRNGDPSDSFGRYQIEFVRLQNKREKNKLD